jgi:uncharacterized protein YfdQ (DUF2303 family)
MNTDIDTQHANIAESLARLLPEAKLLNAIDLEDTPGLKLYQFGIPKGTEVKQIEVDLEKHLDNPRTTNALATLAEADSFVAYVKRHAEPTTSVVWCNFNPQTFALSFTAVLDEHAKGTPGWRRHQATYTPATSLEWNVWTSKSGEQKAQEQAEFAEFLERRDGDIATREGYPTSAEMMQMATNFTATSEKRVRSIVRLQSGGVALEYIDKEDEATAERMTFFAKFCIGIPVFWAGPAYLIDCRLKHRVSQGKAKFHFELIRPDRIHEAAAKDLIERVRTGIGEVPMLMGACK